MPTIYDQQFDKIADRLGVIVARLERLEDVLTRIATSLAAIQTALDGDDDDRDIDDEPDERDVSSIVREAIIGVGKPSVPLGWMEDNQGRLVHPSGWYITMHPTGIGWAVIEW